MSDQTDDAPDLLVIEKKVGTARKHLIDAQSELKPNYASFWHYGILWAAERIPTDYLWRLHDTESFEEGSP